MDCIYGGGSALDLKNFSLNHANFISLRNSSLTFLKYFFQLLFCEELSKLSEILIMRIAGLFLSSVFQNSSCIVTREHSLTSNINQAKAIIQPNSISLS
jgi:hypothetical protein